MIEAKTLPNPIRVDLAKRSYDIAFLSTAEAIAHACAPFCIDNAVVITNPFIWELYGSNLQSALETAGISTTVWHMGDGEKYKSVETVTAAWDYMIGQRHSRKVCIIAFGGGVVGDLAGFVASSYLRGVPFIQVPTTVVAMVDSSVGGKTGVDHPLGKNLIGAFYQPRLVAVNTEFLKTLDAHNLHGGFAEVIKYGVIYDADFFAWLEENLEKAIQLDPEAITHVVRRSCEIKAEVVSQDEFESGLREILNYGHTFGHAIEALGEYQETQFHGQAVAIGMACAADMAVELGMMPESDARRITTLIKRAGLPQYIDANINPADVYDRMFSDKKVAAGKIRFVLPTKIGQVQLQGDIPEALVLKTITNRQR